MVFVESKFKRSKVSRVQLLQDRGCETSFIIQIEELEYEGFLETAFNSLVFNLEFLLDLPAISRLVAIVTF